MTGGNRTMRKAVLFDVVSSRCPFFNKQWLDSHGMENTLAD